MARNLPLGPLGFAELLKRPPYRGRSAELLLRSIYGIRRDAFSKLDKVERLDRLKKGFWRELRAEIQVFPSGNSNFRMETN